VKELLRTTGEYCPCLQKLYPQYIKSNSIQKFKAIVFTNKDGNIINNTNGPETDINEHNNLKLQERTLEG